MASIRIPAAADFHVHLRDGNMMETVVPTVRQGGVSLAYVMVNLLFSSTRNHGF
jgi:dihydroorotase